MKFEPMCLEPNKKLGLKQNLWPQKCVVIHGGGRAQTPMVTPKKIILEMQVRVNRYRWQPSLPNIMLR